MLSKKAEKILSVIVIVVFAALLVMPLAGLNFLSVFSGKHLDVPLYGYTEKAQPVELTYTTWTTGTYQRLYPALLEEKLMPRGVMVKTSNTINYLLFGKASRIVGKNRVIYDTEYVNDELTLTPADDFSDAENIRKLQEFVQDLAELQEKLSRAGKRFMVYVAPSKASALREDLPEKYKAVSVKRDRAVDVFRREIQKTDVPHLICADLAGDVPYPLFYATGIHWSRPYEQYTSSRIVEMLNGITGRNYGRLELGSMKESSTPFYRDDDMLNLINVFYRPRITYYEYETSWQQGAEDAGLRLLIAGDSFSDGLRKDLLENCPGAEVYQVFDDTYLLEPDDSKKMIQLDWTAIDWTEYLDRTDCVVLEMAEPFIKAWSYGFVQHLLKVLDTYQPQAG